MAVPSIEERKRRFVNLLLESLYESVSFAETLLHFLELRTSLSREDLLRRPELFSRELKSLLGEGAKVVERQIIERLCTKLDIDIDEIHEDEFPRCLRQIIRIYLEATTPPKNLNRLY